MSDLSTIKYGDGPRRPETWSRTRFCLWLRSSPTLYPSLWGREEWRLAANLVQAVTGLLLIAGAVYTFYYSPYAKRNEERLEVQRDLAMRDLLDAKGLTERAKSDETAARNGERAAKESEQAARENTKILEQQLLALVEARRQLEERTLAQEKLLSEQQQRTERLSATSTRRRGLFARSTALKPREIQFSADVLP